MSKVTALNVSIGQFFKSASMFTPTSSIVTISAISSGSITFTPALSNYTQIRSASLSWLDPSSLSPFYSITGGGSFQSIDSTAFSVLFSFGSTTTIVTQSNSSFIFNSSSIVGASTRQFSISYLTQSIQSYYDDTVEEAYVQLTIDTTNNENSIKFDTGLLNSTTGEIEFTSNTPVKGGIGTSARGIGSFAMGSGSIAQESASVAEGINTLASGLASHAAGINTTASGQAAFSMGIETDADGMASFAAGSGSWAKGTATVAMGIGTIASASGQTVVGHYNLGLGDFNNLFVVGGGSGATTNLRKNLFRVYGGSGASTVGVEINTSETQNISSFDGFNVYGKTRFFGGVTGSAIDFNAVGVDTKTNLDPILGTITTGSFTSNFYRWQNVLGGDPPAFENVLIASVRLDHRGINFSLSEQTTAPGSTFLWTNSSNRLFYGSSAVILNDGNTLGSTMTIGTNDTNNLQLETNNTTRVLISSSGNVGIGTSSPTERLHVDGNLLVTGRITAEEFHTEFVSASIIYQSGSTKFGNSLDDTHIFTGSLSITGSLNVLGGNIKIDNSYKILGDSNHLTTYNYDSNFPSSTSASFGLVNIGGVGSYITAREDNLFGSSTILQFFTQGSERARITAGGRLGINTTTPGARLVVKGDSFLSSGVTFQALNSSDTTLLYVRDDGNVGIGTTSPTARLEIKDSGATSATTAFRVENSNASASLTILNDGTSAFNTNHLYVSSSGNVGLGTATPVHNLVVNGNTGVSINASGATFPNIYRDSTDGGMLLRSWNGSTFTNNVKITPTTEVGIGTTTPSASLHVQGNFQISTGSLYTYGQNTDIDSGSIRTVMSVSTGSYRAAFFDYVLNKSTNARAGTIFSVWNGASVEWNDVSTNDIGNTAEVNLSVGLSGANVLLYASSSTNDWSMKALARML